MQTIQTIYVCLSDIIYLYHRLNEVHHDYGEKKEIHKFFLYCSLVLYVLLLKIDVSFVHRLNSFDPARVFSILSVDETLEC